MPRTPNRTCKGVVKNGTVVLLDGGALPDGTAVEVRPETVSRGTPGAVLAAAKAPPHLEQSAVEELIRTIEEGRRPVRFDSALD